MRMGRAVAQRLLEPLMAGLMLSAACGPVGRDGELCEPRALGAKTSALYGGVMSSGLIALSESEQSAIVAVVPTLGPPGVVCSGVVVTEREVLTAAHCAGEERLSVLVGAQVAGAQAFDVIKATRHPTADLMVLRVASPGFSTAQVTPLALRQTELDGERWPGTMVQLAGYGEQASARVGERLFLAAELTEVSPDSIVVDGRGRSGACIGDSGGPLLVRGEAGSAQVAGLLWRGDATCMGRDAYLRVDVLRTWIGEQLEEPAAVGAAPRSCRDIPAQGLCQAGTALWCDDGKIQTRACSADRVCGWDVGARGYRCIETALDACSGMGPLGSCDDGVARWCESGTLLEADCTGCGGWCGRASDGRATCYGDDP